jgi:hypothetical protein
MKYLFNFLSLLGFQSIKPKYRVEAKTHNYTHLVCGKDYVIEKSEDTQKSHMTATGQDIKSGDCIIITGADGNNYKYQVEEVDYYSNPPDMWMALLKEVEL